MQKKRVTPEEQQDSLPGGNVHLPGNLKISEICYVGSHNSGCAKVYGWIYAQQTNSLTKQIEFNGARYMKVPLHWFDPTKGCCSMVNMNARESNIPYIAIAHEDDGMSNCRMSILQRGFSFPKLAVIMFQELAMAAKKYPQEVFILKVETYLMSGRTTANGTSSFTKEQVSQKFNELLINSGLMDLAFPWFKPLDVPTLGDLRQGRNVILLSDDQNFMADNKQLYNHTFYAYNYLCQTDWTDDPLIGTISENLARFTKDNVGNIIEPLFEAHFNPQASLSITAYAYFYNAFEFVLNRYTKLSAFYKKQIDFLSSDYIDQGQLAKVVDHLNAELIKNKLLSAQTFEGNHEINMKEEEIKILDC